MFEAMRAKQGESAEESAPYREALDDDGILRTVFHYYRALPLWGGQEFAPVSMPTTFIWPTGSENVSSAAVDALPNWVTGPFAQHIVAGVHQPALQAAPERMIELLVEHLRTHAG